MPTTRQTTVALRGRFEIRTWDGRDVTPPRRKERALVALLALSPQRRRTRAWLQSHLWSDRAPEQASGSLRRALCDLRRTMGPDAAVVVSDRFEVWLGDAVRLDRRPELAGAAELLEAVEAPDPAFEDWLRDLRAADADDGAATGPEAPSAAIDAAARPVRAPARGDGTLVVIRLNEVGADPAAGFLTSVLADAFSTRLEAEGAAEIHVGSEPPPDRVARAATVLRIELSTICESGWWNAHLRALADRDRRFLWSGRLRLPMGIRSIVEGVEIAAFVSTALSQIHARFRAYRLTGRSSLMAMHRATARLYTADRAELARAEAELAALSDGDACAVALAWRAFACVTRALEFGEADPDLLPRAQALAEDAVARRPDAPVVAALAARVAFDLSGDVDRAAHLARAALRADACNPYALYAGAQAALVQGRAREAQDLARRGRLTAEGLPHAFAWDMEMCLVALGTGDLTLARRSARAAHAANRAFRPALRYLVALDLLRGDHEGAARHAARLRTHEPGFEPAHLRRPDYPALTLRSTGYAEALPG